MASSSLSQSHNVGFCKIQHFVMGVARIKTSRPSSRLAVQAAGMANLYRKIICKRRPPMCMLQNKVPAKDCKVAAKEVIIWEFPKKGLDLQLEKNGTEDLIQKVVFNCRFFTLMGVGGTLIGSILCFFRESFLKYFHRLSIFKGLESAHEILPLVEAIDVYLMGTVMLIFGIGLYELFISNLRIPSIASFEPPHTRSSFFGLFALQERPAWLEVKSVEEVTAKVERVMMMIVLLSLLDKSKWVVISTPLDLLCFSATILFSFASIFLLSKLSR